MKDTNKRANRKVIKTLNTKSEKHECMSTHSKDSHIALSLVCRPRGKESTEVRKSQIKGKKSENSYQEFKRSRKGQAHTNTRKLNRDISTGTAVFLNRKRVNVCEHTTKMASLESCSNTFTLL